MNPTHIVPTVLITPEAMREVEGPYVEMLRKAGLAVLYPKNPTFARGLCGEEETVAELSVADASIAGAEEYSARVLHRLPRLRVIARCGVGYDRVDVAAATAQGVVLTITPTTTTGSVVELTLALMLGVAKSTVANDGKVRRGEWPRKLTMPLRGKTLGIFGLGRIGSSLAVRAAALGMKILATDIAPNPKSPREHGIEMVDLDTLLAHSDFLSVHCPLNKTTRGFFDREKFAKMKCGSVFINTSRGGVVVERDLCWALESGHLGGAGLDVFELEPPARDNPLFQFESVVLSPHLGGTDETSIVEMGVEAADCLIKLHRGDWPEGAVVNSDLRSGWRWTRD
jgi:phosphoglycerate dehydrogenase-like enzyme